MYEAPILNEWIPLNKRTKLSIGHILAIASSNLIAGNIYNIIFVYLEPYETRLNISFIGRTLILLGGSLIGFIITPLIGFYSDRTMLQFGRRRIFIMVGLFFSMISLLLMINCSEIVKFFNHGNESRTTAIVVFVIGAIFGIVSANVIQLPARVMCSDVTPKGQQNLMANICQAFNGSAPLITNVLGFIGIDKFTSPNPEFILLLISLFIAFAATVISIVSTHEEPLYVHPQSITPFKQIHDSIKKMPKPFKSVLLPYFFAYLAIYQFTFSFSDFISYEIYNEADKFDINKRVRFAMLCLSMNNFLQLVYGFCNFKVCEVIGMKWTMVIGNSLLTLSLTMFLIIKAQFAYIAFAGLIGISTVVYMAVPAAIISIVIPTEELGVNFGILNCVCVLAQQISNIGIGFGLTKILGISPGKKIGYSAVFGVCATFASFWIIEPASSENGGYAQIHDLSKTGDYDDHNPLIY